MAKMSFDDLPVDIVLYIAQFLTDRSIANLMQTNKSNADTLIARLYNPILKATNTPKNAMYSRGRGEPSWVRYIRIWRSETVLNYFTLSSPDYLQYKGHRHREGLLHLVAKSGNCRLLVVCKKIGFDIEAQDDEGKTPLHYALQYGRERAATILFEVGAEYMPLEGYSLLLAVENCFVNLVEDILLRMCEAEYRPGNRRFESFQRSHTIQYIKNVSLTAATLRGAPEIVEVLLEYGADPEWQTYSDLYVQMHRSYVLGY